MRTLLRHALLILLASPALAGTGTEFWAVLSTDDGMRFPLTIVVGNPDPALTASIVIETETGPVASGPVPPLEAVTFDLPFARNASRTDRDLMAYRVTSDLPVHAYQAIDFSGTYSNTTGSILVDRSHLGTEYLALALTADDSEGRPSLVTIVAPESARVEVTPAQDTVAGLTVPALAAGVPVTFDLAPFEVLQLASLELGDLTGTSVRSDVPVEVFAGCHTCTITLGDESRANSVQEWMLPLPLWGTMYHAITSNPQTIDTNLWRVLASVDGTVVTTDPPQSGTPASLDRGEFLELAVSTDFTISATAPVLAARYTTVTTVPGEGGASPSMMLLLPPERFATGGVFALPNSYPWFVNWVDVVAPPGATVLVDGVAIPGADFTPIGGSGYFHGQVRLSNATESHSVESDVPAGVYAGHACCAQAMGFPLAIGFPVDLAPVCDAGGPYSVACAGPMTPLAVSGAGSSDPEARPLTFAWSSPAPEVDFDDASLSDPTVTVTGLGTFTLDLAVSDGTNVTRCSTSVTTTGSATVPPELDRLATPLWLAKRGGDILFSWQDLGGSPTAYNVYEGSIGSYWSHAPLRCGESGMGSGPGRRESRLTPSGGSHYYLMTASNCFAEGPSGGEPAPSACPP